MEVKDMKYILEEEMAEIREASEKQKMLLRFKKEIKGIKFEEFNN